MEATLVLLFAAAAAAAAEEHDEPVESANNDGTEKVYMHINDKLLAKGRLASLTVRIYGVRNDFGFTFHSLRATSGRLSFRRNFLVGTTHTLMCLRSAKKCPIKQ